MVKVAALYVEKGGVYWNLPEVDPWDPQRDARLYSGPWPVVAHPPCERWGRYWSGGPSARVRRKLGDDDGCFEAALAAVRRFGGVLEHPEGSHAWRVFGLNLPPHTGGWVNADFIGGWTCCVEQGHYGHFSRKPTWLYAVGIDLPALIWGPSEQRIHPVALARHGYEKARRIGVMAMVGGKDKTRIRNATPVEFRDVLIAMARTAAAAKGSRMTAMGNTADDGFCIAAGRAPLPVAPTNRTPRAHMLASRRAEQSFLSVGLKSNARSE